MTIMGLVAKGLVARGRANKGRRVVVETGFRIDDHHRLLAVECEHAVLALLSPSRGIVNFPTLEALHKVNEALLLEETHE